MMKTKKTIQIGMMLCHKMASVFAALAMLVACSEDLPLMQPEDSPQIAPDALVITPRLFSLADNQKIPPTRAVGDDVDPEDGYREDYIGRIDVFLLDGDNVFKHYSQTPGTDAGFENGKPVTLSANWKAEDLVPGKQYDVYVLVNNRNMEAGVTPKTRAELLALSTKDEDIHKRYREGANAGSEIFSADKTFMMDGFVESWTPQADATSQDIPVTLKRAAAKVVATFELSTDMEAVDAEGDPIFVKAETAEDGYNQSENWIYSKTSQTGVTYYSDAEKTTPVDASEVLTDADGAKVRARMSFEEYLGLMGHSLGTGSPMWKYVNFSRTARDIESAPLPADYSLAVSDDVLGLEDGTNWTISTYTYEQDWEEVAKAEECAPYLLVSIPILLNGDEQPTYHYYRLPIVDESKLTSTQRNTVYYSHTKIESLGSTSLDELIMPVNLRFEVLPWEIGETEVTNVLSSHLFYLLVQPTEAELRGSNPNTIDLAYYAPSSNQVLIDASSLEISYLNSEKKRSYLVNGGKQYTINNGSFSLSGTEFVEDNQEIEVNFSGTISSENVSNHTLIRINNNGQISIESEVLYNQAIKTIKFRVYLSGFEEKLYQDIVIQHYPVDNIQSFEGWWSSKYSSYSTGKKTVREYTYSLAEALSWEINVNTKFETEETTKEYCDPELTKETTTPGTPTSNGGYEEGPEEIDQATFKDNVNNNYRQEANGEENAVKNGNYYYWGVNPTTTNWQNYDYYVSYYGNYTAYKYNKYYRAKYKDKVSYTYYRKKWYREIEIDALQITSDWVQWDDREAHSPVRTYNENGFRAKVYEGNQCNYLTESRVYSSTYQTEKGSIRENTNNHMYVIQITSASSQYVLGSPTLDANYQSKDNVVYPALMMASQLGAVTSGYFNATSAATHCGQYMEVDVNGKKFLGWRLPTDAEIKVIYNYQYQTKAQDVIVEVLGGERYYNLHGSNTKNPEVSGSDIFVRCVRELTEDDLKYLRHLNGETVPGFDLTYYLNN